MVLLDSRPKFYFNDGAGLLQGEYPFLVDGDNLKAAGLSIAGSRSNIPTSFQGSWDDIIQKSSHTRMVDYIDFLLYIIPTLICPIIPNTAARDALYLLSKGCSLALQWRITSYDLVEMERCFACWHAFLKAEIDAGNLSKKVFRPINHYLVHIPHVIRHLGPMRAYSTRAMERTIGRYSRLITFRVLSGTHASNLVEKLAIRQYVNITVKTEKQLNLIKKKTYSDKTFINPPASSSSTHQLWSPITFNFSIESGDYRKFTKRQFDSTIFSTAIIQYYNLICITNGIFTYTLLLYGNRNRSSPHWFVGKTVFFFTHIHNQIENHLLLVEVAKNHTQCKFNRFIPVVELFGEGEIPFFAVIDIGQITAQVGLVKNPQNDTHSVVSPYLVFDKELSSAGRLSYL
ncbi:hypothetical protein BDB01DRAFT_725312 [Pilobolus umbonatus]|nr:hypothetical protein BDB01DRAFT_725312 [Pilobolus umbonatus]